MGKRSTGRKLAMQLLYQLEMQHGNLESVKDVFTEYATYEESTKQWALSLFEGTVSAFESCDALINKYSIGWELKRINAIDKCILRLAFYELLKTETPHTIILNEAIELSKRYSTADSPKFINGILGAWVKDKCSQESSKA